MAGKLKKFNKIIGFEISESSIFALEVEFVKNNAIISNSLRSDIAIFEDPTKVIQYLKQDLKSCGFKIKDSVIGLSMQFFKLFPIPIPETIPQNEINLILAQEGGVDLNNEYLTWLPLKNTRRQDADGIVRYDVLGISIQKNLAESLKTIFKACGLNVHTVTPSFLGLSYFLNDLVDSNLVTTLWVSKLKSELVVWSGKNPIYESMFLTHQLSDQIFQSINFIQTQLPGTQVVSIYSCGPFASDVDYTNVPYPVKPFELANNILDRGNIPAKIDFNEAIGPLSIALLASNRYGASLPDLTTSAVSGKSILSFLDKIPLNISGGIDRLLVRYVTLSIIVFFLTLFLGFYVQKILLPSVSQAKSDSSYKVKLAESRLSSVLQNEKANKVLQVKVEFLSDLIEHRIPWSKIVREIADVTPKSLWIDRLEIRNKKIDIFGRSLSVDSVANFSINLNYNAKLLGNAQIVSLRKFQEDEIDFVEFQLSVQTKLNTEQPEGAQDVAESKTSI